MRFADLEGLPSDIIMGPVNARPLQDVKLNHDEGNRTERPGRFLTTRVPIRQHVEMLKQIRGPPGHVKDRAYPKQVAQEGDVQRYVGLKAIRKDETIFAAYDKAETRKAKIMIVANSDLVYNSKSLFWSNVIMLYLSLAMRTYPLALIRGATEFVTVIYGPAVTFALPDVKVEAYRRSVLHLNLISAVDGSALIWCEQQALRESMSEDLLFAKISEPEMTVINFDDHFRDRMGEVDRGHIEVFPKLRNLRPYGKTNGEVTRISRLTAAYHKLREETKGWGDYKKLTEFIPKFPLIRRMLLEADSVVQTTRSKAFETNERSVAKFSEMMDSCFVGRNAAVLQYTQFAYTDEITRRRMSNTATPKPGRFDEEWAKLDLAPMIMRGEADLPEASLILTSVKPELTVGRTLQTKTMLAPFGCEEVKVVHGEEEDQSAGRLVVPKFPDGATNEEQGSSSSGKDPKRHDGQEGRLQSEEPMQQDPDQADKEDDKASTGGMFSLNFNFLSDFDNGTDTLEATTEPADEGTSTLEPLSAFVETNRNLAESSSPSNSKNTEKKLLMESPRKRRIEGTARVPFLGTLTEEEWEVHHRDHENRVGCTMDRVAFFRGRGLDSSSELRDPVYFENRSQQTTNAGSP